MVTLTGTFTRLDGDPATGTVRITPSRSPIMDPNGKTVISGPQTFGLDKDGKLVDKEGKPVKLPASNDPDLGPPFVYSIDVNLAHSSWKISRVWIPYGTTTMDLTDIRDYTPTPGVTTRVVTIPADGTDGQVLVWDGGGFSWADPPKGDKGDDGDPGTSDITVDTSVGTRVFANGIMVYGDTGWRTISSWDENGELTGTAHTRVSATPGVAGSIQMRRENKVVEVAMRGITFPETPGPTINLPNGFGGSEPFIRWPVTLPDRTFLVAVGRDRAFFNGLQASVNLGAQYGTVLRFQTDTPWPTTLPGLPG